jgi:glycosyltransferase involved in cell wall biosynthesis
VTKREAPTARSVLLLASYAPSLIIFRGPLIADLVARGHRVLAAAPAIDAETGEALRRLGAEPHSIALSNASLSPFALLASYRALRRFLRAARPDVLIAYTIKPVILGALAGRAERVGRIVAMITGLGFAFTGGRQPKRLLSRVAASILYRLALRRADIVLFQNKDDEALFRGLALLERASPSAIINGSGIDLQAFAPSPVPVSLSFLMIARLLGDKGVREFALAASRLKAVHPAVRIRLVGYLDPSPDSIGQAELDAIIGSGVEFLGKLDDVRPAIAACSVYVLPSYREGTPRSVLEAMAMGRAVITTDAPGCRETVVDGENGFLVLPRDADALFEAMLRFVDAPQLAGAMGSVSRRMAEERYDVHKVNADIIAHAGL